MKVKQVVGTGFTLSILISLYLLYLIASGEKVLFLGGDSVYGHWIYWLPLAFLGVTELPSTISVLFQKDGNETWNKTLNAPKAFVVFLGAVLVPVILNAVLFYAFHFVVDLFI